MTKPQDHSILQCSDAQDCLCAMIDEETVKLDSAALELHLNACSDCRTFYNDQRQLHARLRAELAGYCDVDRIWRNIERDIVRYDEQSSQTAVSYPQAEIEGVRVLGTRRIAAMAAAILVVFFLAGTSLFAPIARSLPVTMETIRDFETFRQLGGRLDIQASDPDVVRRWMMARTNFTMPRNINPPKGFNITGGRLCLFLNRRLVFLQYDKGTVTVSLYIMKATGLKLPKSGTIDFSLPHNALTTATWQRGGLAYVVVSDLSRGDIKSIASSLKDQQAIEKQAPARRL